MKKVKKVVSSLAAALMMMTVFSVAASADAELDITFRVEGPDSNIYYDTLSVPYSGSLTAADAFEYLDEKSDEVEFTGVSDGYISKVNDIGAGKFGGWDGWYYAVDDVAPSVGIGDFTLSDGDVLVLYYGGYPCQIPIADTSKLDSEGIISFTSNDTEYDENYNATQVVNKVVDATVTVNGNDYTTDENGEIKIPNDKLESTLSVQIDKKDSSGAPAVLRFAPDYTISCNVSSDTDTDANTDTDLNTDTDTYTATDTDTDTESNTSSKASSTASTTSVTSSTKTTTTATATTGTTATTTSSAADTAQTGDGRTYLAIGVLVIAIVIVVMMVALRKKK